MSNSIRTTLGSLPILGRALKITNQIVHLPEIQQQQRVQQDTLARLHEDLKAQAHQLAAATEGLSQKLDQIQLQHDNLQRQLSIIDKNLGHSVETSSKLSSRDELFADDHMMDNFYTDFEDRFRGSEDMIQERLTEYLPYFKDAEVNFKDHPVLDIGCGRGEFLQLLKKHKINATGLDINIDMVERANKKGLIASRGDALSYLQERSVQSLGAITGFHIVEHIPFNMLLRIFSATNQALVKGGFVIFETPNPENIIVGSSTFYMDPSHLHPLPPPLLAFALESCGFKNVQILRLHPDTDHKGGKLPADVIEKFYGARDYAVIGYK